MHVEAAAGADATSCPRTGLRPAFGLVLGLLLAVFVGAADARQPTGLGEPVALGNLPAEAQLTVKRIRAGGPFPYSKDGVVFGNRERRLARQPHGYYHEYTVPSPGAHDRGARRVVCGGRKPTEPEACFYTEDHYNSFHQIVN